MSEFRRRKVPELPHLRTDETLELGPQEAKVLDVLVRADKYGGGWIGMGAVAFLAQVRERTARYHLNRFVARGDAEAQIRDGFLVYRRRERVTVTAPE